MNRQPRPVWRRWPVLAGLAGILVVAGVVAVAYFGVHKLFVDDVVDEAGPVFDSGASERDEPASSDDDGGGSPAATEPAGAGGDGPQVTTLAEGTFEGVGHQGTGTVKVLGDGTDQRFLRFDDDFATDNGPDLFVYLGTGSGEYGDPTQYVEVGMLRGNIGSQNYEIPATHPTTGEPIDLGSFDHVAVWCKRFDSTFAVAELA